MLVTVIRSRLASQCGVSPGDSVWALHNREASWWPRATLGPHPPPWVRGGSGHLSQGGETLVTGWRWLLGPREDGSQARA